MKKVNFSKTILTALIIGLTSCSQSNTIQITEKTICCSGFTAPNKFETSVLFPDYMVADYKSRNMSTKGFSIKQMKQVDAVRIVIKSEEDGTKQEKIVYPSSTQVTATFDNVSVGRVKVYAEAWGTGGYQPTNTANVITSGEAYVAVSENKLSEAFIALEIPKAQVDAFIEKKYGKGSVKAIVTLVEKVEINSNTQTIINNNTNNSYRFSADPYNKYQVYDSDSKPIKTPQLKGGNATHNLSPAELIYYSSKENLINPILLISKLQDEQSLIEIGINDNFERRLLRACGYGALDSGDIPFWYGFYPQLVSTTFQFEKYRMQGKNFDEAYKTFTTGQGKVDNFKNNIYPKYANKMNEISNKNYDINNGNYFHDFRDITIDDIQSLLEQYNGELKNKNLFRS